MCRSLADGGQRCTRPDHEQDRQRRLRAAARHQHAHDEITALIGATPFRPESADLLAMSSRDSYYESDEWQEWSDRIQTLADRYGVTLDRGQPPAEGLWLGESEPSGAYVVSGTPQAIEQWAAHLAGHYDQDAVMVLYPGGGDTLYTFPRVRDSAVALEAMEQAGISGARYVDGDLEIVATADSPLTEDALRLLRVRLGVPASAVTHAPVTAKFIEKDEDRRTHRPLKDIQGVRQRHAEAHGLPVRKPVPHLSDADDIAASMAYETGVHDVNDPKVQRSYRCLTRHLREQHDALIEAGYTFEPWDGDGQPYANSAEMMTDLRDSKHLFYYRTEVSQDTEGALRPDHPMARTVTVRAADGGTQKMMANDCFRAVHDAIAHSEGHQFGRHGEKLAWWTHRSSLPREAHLALWNETRAQNVYTNAGPHLRTTDSDGSVRLLTRGEPGWLPLADRPYAEQKCVAAPASLT